MEYQYLGTGAAEGMPATFCACPVCLRSMREGGKSLRMRACTLLGDDVLIDLSPDIHAQKLRFGLRLDRLKCIVFTHSHPDHQDIYALQNRGTPSPRASPGCAGGRKRAGSIRQSVGEKALPFGLRRCGTGEGRALPLSRGEAV
ncbi:MAG: hypothetical protein ACLVB5_05105 [Christensenellales bacterium]